MFIFILVYYSVKTEKSNNISEIPNRFLTAVNKKAKPGSRRLCFRGLFELEFNRIVVPN
jgi:hypothetical protein